MPGYQILHQHAAHFLTFATVRWVDVFTRPVYREIMLEALHYCQEKKGLRLYAWVLMPNHVHLVAQTEAPHYLSGVLRDLKRHTAQKLYATIRDEPTESRKDWMLWLFRDTGTANIHNEQFQLWQQDNHPMEITGGDFLRQKVDYIHQNPVRAGWVWNAEDYPYSSATDYAGKPGLLKVELAF